MDKKQMIQKRFEEETGTIKPLSNGFDKIAYLQKFNNWLADQLTEQGGDSNMVSLLKIAKCPNCDGSGTMVVSTDNEGNIDEIAPCQWCYERKKLTNQ